MTVRLPKAERFGLIKFTIFQGYLITIKSGPDFVLVPHYRSRSRNLVLFFKKNHQEKRHGKNDKEKDKAEQERVEFFVHSVRLK